MNGFRIVTETTVKGTTLKENGGPVARTVYVGKPDNFIDGRFLHDAAPSDPGHGRHPGRPFQTE